MSIFPKRTIPGKTVTIHWNFNIAHLTDMHIVPFVRIGVKAPDGHVTILFEQHLLGLPGIRVQPDEAPDPAPKYLNKNTPLLVLADYLSGRHKRQQLVDILRNIQGGTHHYFTYQIPENGCLGKYHIISEIYNGGEIKYSTTAADDFFFVEKIVVRHGDGQASLHNISPEKTPVKIVHYTPGTAVEAAGVMAFEMMPSEMKYIPAGMNTFLLYNEERIVLPLFEQPGKRCVRNQQLLTLEKGNELHLMGDNDHAYTLSGLSLEIWRGADGIRCTSQIRSPENEAVYDEMLAAGIIVEY